MSKKYKVEVNYYDTEEEATNGMKKMIKENFKNDSKLIPCECVACGGIGFAQDESMIDHEGFLIDMKCPCGGRIKRLQF